MVRFTSWRRPIYRGKGFWFGIHKSSFYLGWIAAWMLVATIWMAWGPR